MLQINAKLKLHVWKIRSTYQELNGKMMAINHARQAEVIHLQPLGSKIDSTKTYTLFKTDVMEVIRLVMPAGKQIAEHKAPGEITVHCLEGRIRFTSQQKPKELAAGDLLYLHTADPHSVEAIEDSTVLVTIQLGTSSKHENGSK